MMKILGVEIYEGSKALFVKHIIRECMAPREKSEAIGVVDSNCLVLANRNESLKTILNSFYANIPDGAPVAWLGRRSGVKNMKRFCGPDLFETLLRETADKPINHYFFGGKPGVAEKLKYFCREVLKNKNVVGVYSPPFRELTEEEIRDMASDIDEKASDILWISVSPPKSFIIADIFAKCSSVRYIIPVGAVFDFMTNEKKRAPVIMQKCGVEWLFRVFCEPRRLFLRYVKTGFFMIFFLLRERSTGERYGDGK